MSKEQFKRSLQTELKKVVEGVDKPVAEFVATSVATPMAEAIEDSLAEAAQTDLSSLFDTLKTLDGDVRDLRLLSGQETPAQSTYESWARYWAAVSPDLQVVRKLVREVVIPKLSTVRQQIATRRGLPYASYSLGQLRGSMLSIPDGSETMTVDSTIQAGDYWRSQARRYRVANHPGASPRLLSFGTCLAEVTIRCDTRDAVSNLFMIGRSQAAEQTLYRVPLATSMCSEFESRCTSTNVMRRVDEEASEHVPNAQFEGFGAAFAECAASLYATALVKQADPIPIVAKAPAFAGRIGLFDVSLPPATVVGASALLAVLVHNPLNGALPAKLLTVFVFAVLFAGLRFLSWALLMRRLRTEFDQSLRRSVSALDASAAEMAARSIDESFMDRVLAKITVKLSPRPLQRALNRSLE